MKKYDVIALGELLIDFTGNGVSSQGNPLFEANPGGAPCNVLAMLQKLGKKTAFIGKVGDDMFGEILTKAVEEQGIDTKYLTKTKEVPTTLAFVHTKEDGDRSFSFYRNPGADMMLEKSDLEEVDFTETKIFHFGTLSMTEEKIADVTKSAISEAKKAGALISFDPNYRNLLWSSEDKAREAIWYGIGQCDILKISDDEIEFITGEADIDKGVEIISARTNARLICATLGRDGSKAFYKDLKVFVEPYLQENTIETTGAGDTFMACTLYGILNNGIDELTEEKIIDVLKFANAAASIITTRKGALRVMPDLEEVKALCYETLDKEKMDSIII